jgi:endoglucanase
MISFIWRDRRVLGRIGCRTVLTLAIMAWLLRGTILFAILIGLLLPASASARALSVSGNHLVNESGHQIRLLGVSRSGSEYACADGYGFFDGPTGARSIRAMKRWGINTVRVPLNPDCWLGIDGVKPDLAGEAYRAAIDGFVSRLNRAGLYVVIDEHVAGPDGWLARGIIPMPDADSSPAFWRSVATHFAANHSLVFDLYNEPHDVGWDCWLGGCGIEAGGRFTERHPAYRAAGMQELIDAVRSTGATQPLMLGGVDYARDLSGWLAHRPIDPLRQLVASEHNYGHHLAPCLRGCKTAIAAVSASVPVVVGELGQTDCRHDYIDKWMRWADRRGISYIGWAWDAKEGWTCHAGPSLIENYRGKPTGFGIGFRNHLLKLRRHARG